MKHSGTFWLVIAGSTALLATPASGVTDTAGANPYQRIVDRNVFGLRPPPPPPDPNEQPVVAPAKILLQGITDILGRKQVLMKVQPPPPGKEFSLVLDEGRAENEVEVLEINEVAGTVKVKNYGVVQSLSLDKDGAKPTGAPPPGPGVPGAPGVPVPPMPTPAAVPFSGAAGGVTTVGGAGLRTIPTRQVRSGNQPAQQGAGQIGGLRAGGMQVGGTGQSGLSLEEQTVIMEAQRRLTADAVKSGDLPPMPPTDATHLLNPDMMPPSPGGPPAPQ